MLSVLLFALGAAPTLEVSVRDVHGAPVPEAEVRVAGEAAFVTTDARGVALLPARLPVSVLVSHPDFLVSSAEEVTQGTVELRLRRAPVITGLVSDETGAPMSGVEVWCNGGRATTDERGAFRVVSQLEGKQRLTCLGSEHDARCVEASFEAKGGDELRQELTAYRLSAELTIIVSGSSAPELGFRRAGRWLPHLTVEAKRSTFTSRVPAGELELVVLEGEKPRFKKVLVLQPGDRRTERVKLGR